MTRFFLELALGVGLTPGGWLVGKWIGEWFRPPTRYGLEPAPPRDMFGNLKEPKHSAAEQSKREGRLVTGIDGNTYREVYRAEGRRHVVINAALCQKHGHVPDVASGCQQCRVDAHRNLGIPMRQEIKLPPDDRPMIYEPGCGCAKVTAWGGQIVSVRHAPDCVWWWVYPQSWQ